MYVCMYVYTYIKNLLSATVNENKNILMDGYILYYVCVCVYFVICIKILLSKGNHLFFWFFFFLLFISNQNQSKYFEFHDKKLLQSV